MPEQKRPTEPTSPLPARVSIADDVLYQRLDDAVILLHVEGDRYYGLDEVGAQMWQVLEETGDPERVVRAICDAYDVTEAQVRADLARLLDDLSGARLVRVETPA